MNFTRQPCRSALLTFHFLFYQMSYMHRNKKAEFLMVPFIWGTAKHLVSRKAQEIQPDTLAELTECLSSLTDEFGGFQMRE